jgi:hypothetical protein
MKKTLLLAAALLSLSAAAQDEWNSTPNSFVPMFRDGFVGIGTSPYGGMPNAHLAITDPAGWSGTHVSFGNNGLQSPYGLNESVLEITNQSIGQPVRMDLVTGAGANRYDFRMTLDANEARIDASSPVAGAVCQPIVFSTQNGVLAEAMRIGVDGKVSIGSPAGGTPGTYRLYVREGILTEKVKVAVDGSALWADYVFAPDYKLKPIEEVSAFIKKNRHLPGVPSAEEITKEGLDVAAMDAKLLEKIEEMMLYIIDLKQEVEQLKKQNSSLKSSK